MTFLKKKEAEIEYIEVDSVEMVNSQMMTVKRRVPKPPKIDAAEVSKEIAALTKEAAELDQKIQLFNAQAAELAPIPTEKVAAALALLIHWAQGKGFDAPVESADFAMKKARYTTESAKLQTQRQAIGKQLTELQTKLMEANGKKYNFS